MTNHCNFHVLTTNHITTTLTNPNHDQSHKSSDDDSSLDCEDDYHSDSRNVRHHHQSFQRLPSPKRQARHKITILLPWNLAIVSTA